MATMNGRRLRILGIRGVPAAHGGFETFAEQLALHLVARGWAVTVYCQGAGRGPLSIDNWQGVERVHIPVDMAGPKGTIVFDWRAVAHAAGFPADLCLTLGYNTAVFCARLRWRGVRNLINMDGIEWQRAKWGPVARAWFWLNERAGCWLGDHLIADHPDIKAHLVTRVRAAKITTIAYGADKPRGTDSTLLAPLGLQAGNYLSVIARPEPENSLLEIVAGFSSKPRGSKLAVLGHYDDANAYHRRVRAAAGAEVVFAGAIYDKAVVQTLREHCVAYVHGHQVGGTNPSLVEALAAGNAVIAHDNRFNRWVAGPGARYFAGADGFSRQLDELLPSQASLGAMRRASETRFEEAFTWPRILGDYERLLEAHVPRAGRSSSSPG